MIGAITNRSTQVEYPPTYSGPEAKSDDKRVPHIGVTWVEPSCEQGPKTHVLVFLRPNNK